MEVLLAVLATAGATLLLMFGGIVLVGGVVWLCSWWLTREEVARFGNHKAFWPGSRAASAPTSMGPDKAPVFGNASLKKAGPERTRRRAA